MPAWFGLLSRSDAADAFLFSAASASLFFGLAGLVGLFGFAGNAHRNRPLEELAREFSQNGFIVGKIPVVNAVLGITMR